MPGLRGLQRAQVWNAPGHVCLSCRHQLLAQRQRFSRRQSNLTPAQDAGGDDDWLSNFNDLSSANTTKRGSFFETGKQHTSKNASTPSGGSSTRQSRSERIRSLQRQSRNAGRDGTASKGRPSKRPALATTAPAGSNNMASLTSTLNQRIGKNAPDDKAAVTTARSLQTPEQRLSFERSHTRELVERLQHAAASHFKLAEGDSDTVGCFNDTTEINSSSSDHIEQAKLYKEAASMVEHGIQLWEDRRSGVTNPARYSFPLERVFGNQSVNKLQLQCKWHAGKLEEHKQKLADLTDDTQQRLVHEKAKRVHEVGLVIFRERLAMQRDRDESTVDASEPTQSTAVARSSKPGALSREERMTMEEIVPKMSERLERLKSSYLVSEESHSSGSGISVEPVDTEVVESRQGEEDAMLRIKVLADAIHALDQLPDSLQEINEGLVDPGIPTIPHAVALRLFKVPGPDITSPSADRRHLQHVENEIARSEQATQSAEDEETRRSHEAAVHLGKVMTAIVKARQAVRADMDPRNVNASKTGASTAFERLGSQASSRARKRSSTEARVARRKPVEEAINSPEAEDAVEFTQSLPRADSRTQYETVLQKLKSPSGPINQIMQNLLARFRSPGARDSALWQPSSLSMSAAESQDTPPTSAQISAPRFASAPPPSESQIFQNANANMISDLRPIKGEAAYPGFSTSPSPPPPSFAAAKAAAKPDKPLSLAQKVDEAKYRPKWGGTANVANEHRPATPPKATIQTSTPEHAKTEGERGVRIRFEHRDSTLAYSDAFGNMVKPAFHAQLNLRGPGASPVLADSPCELNELPLDAYTSTDTSRSVPFNVPRENTVVKSSVSPSSSFSRIKRGLSAELRRRPRPEPESVSIESLNMLVPQDENPAVAAQSYGDEALDSSETTSEPIVPGEAATQPELQSPTVPKCTKGGSTIAATGYEHEDRFSPLDALRTSKDDRSGNSKRSERAAAAQHVVDFYSERPDGEIVDNLGFKHKSESPDRNHAGDASSRLSSLHLRKASIEDQVRSGEQKDASTPGSPMKDAASSEEAIPQANTSLRLDLSKLSPSRRRQFEDRIQREIAQGRLSSATVTNRKVRNLFRAFLHTEEKIAQAKSKARTKARTKARNIGGATSNMGAAAAAATASASPTEDPTSGTSGHDDHGDDDGDHKSLAEVMRQAEALSGSQSEIAPETALDKDAMESATQEDDSPPLDLSSSEPTDILAIKPAELKVEALNIPQPSVPGLEYGLDRVLFNPGVYQLQDPLSRVYNFDPYLQKIMPVTEFDFNALKEYKTSSQDKMLSSLAREHDKRYIGSTSSMTGTLGHFHYLLSDWRPLNLNMFSKAFPEKLDSFTQLNRAPNAIFLRWKNGTYAIDADKQYDSGNVLMLLGKSMEKLLTMPTSDYERYRKSDPRTVSEAERNDPEAFEYTTMGDFLMRSQLDAYDPRLPGTGMFDLKTRAVVSVRMDAEDFEPMTGYEIHTLQGRFGSYEREYYDMIRSTMLKYMLQARMGRMEGIFVAYHNVERIFGFQYLPIQEMDRALHGQVDRALGDQEFKTSLDLMNKVFDKATAKFPEQSMRFHFETTTESLGGSPTTVMWIFGEPMEESKIETIQATSKAKVAEFERTMMGVNKEEKETSTSLEDEASGDESQSKGETVVPKTSDVAQPTTSKAAQPVSAEYVTSNSGADPEFMSSISSQSEMERQPLFAASLICKSRVNGVSVQRPESLKPTDTWEVEYLLREWDAPDAMWSKYEQMKARRRDMFERLGSEEEAEDNNGELTKEQKRSRNFIDFLRSMSQQGREFRSKIDQLEAGQKPTVVGEPSKSSIVEDEVGHVDEYMSWLYGGEKK